MDEAGVAKAAVVQASTCLRVRSFCVVTGRGSALYRSALRPWVEMAMMTPDAGVRRGGAGRACAARACPHASEATARGCGAGALDDAPSC